MYGSGAGGGDVKVLLSPGSFTVMQLDIQQLSQWLRYLRYTYRQLTEAQTDLKKAASLLRGTD